MGVLPGIGGMAGRGPRLLSFVDSGSSSNLSTGLTQLPVPAAAKPGDIAISFDVVGNTSGTYLANVPAGFTQLGLRTGTPGSTIQGLIAAKILNGSEAGTTLTGQDCGGGAQPGRHGAVLVYRPTWAISSFAIGAAFAAQTLVGDPTSQSTGSASGPVPLIAIGMNGTHTGSLVSPTNTGTMDVVNSPSRRLQALAAALGELTAASSFTVDVGNSGPTIIMTGYLKLT